MTFEPMHKYSKKNRCFFRFKKHHFHIAILNVNEIERYALFSLYQLRLQLKTGSVSRVLCISKLWYRKIPELLWMLDPFPFQFMPVVFQSIQCSDGMVAEFHCHHRMCRTKIDRYAFSKSYWTTQNFSNNAQKYLNVLSLSRILLYLFGVIVWCIGHRAVVIQNMYKEQRENAALGLLECPLCLWNAIHWDIPFV